jgi:hypothetical protein
MTRKLDLLAIATLASIGAGAVLAAGAATADSPAPAAAPPMASIVSMAAPAAKPTDEEAAVLATMDRYMRAITAKDLRGMTAMQMPDGMTYRLRAGADGSWTVAGRTNADWLDPAKADARTHRERYWSPTVLVRGAMAVVWAPYEFWLDGKTSHCGVDVFDFVKVDGVWRVANSMWTVEPEACAELRPKDPSAIRPAD